uniref:Uncharacterized protein n=1 Tax=Chromera velia CCMP2878 TaxID=1169474 RepID=A0A0G4HIJ5_9ALVE|eukprot:Cvel_27870.t1-p1 / transcript=Cvel_27870.t1 / gene=Cvel_27870 / organism=Chromera_velia_CCMP2878 / gene_product=hypothetical protein / transcript_product=hypothetical protein / location=Cvel_scaffold3547:14011-15555(+) / protein_length=161 / sequence_SO=supercontig / SO=protein_coding / is_pseudo=false
MRPPRHSPNQLGVSQKVSWRKGAKRRETALPRGPARGIGLSVTVLPPPIQYNTVVATDPFIPVPAHLHIGGVSEAPSDSKASSKTPSPLPFASASPTQAFKNEGVLTAEEGNARNSGPAGQFSTPGCGSLCALERGVKALGYMEGILSDFVAQESCRTAIS